MTRRFALPFIALVLAAPLAAQQSVQDFQLPPAPTPTASPNVQGPVDTEAPVPVAPRVIRPQASPTPSATPVPTPAPTPRASPSPRPTDTRQPVQPIPTNQPPVTRPAPTAEPTIAPTPLPEVEALPGTPVELPAPPEGLASQPTATPATSPTTESAGGLDWLPWIGGALALLLAGLAGWLWWRRKSEAAEPPVIAPPIVPPRAAPDPAPPIPSEEKLEAAIAAPAAMPETDNPVPEPVFGTPQATGGALTFEAEAVKLSRSMVYARLSYLLRVTNGTKQALEEVEIAGDLVSASNGRPVAEQVADEATALGRQHLIDRLEPGETHFAKGELALPLSAVDPILQGRTPLLVPLMRWRVSAASGSRLTQTHVVGLSPLEPSGKLQPFRLDIPPQTFDAIGNRQVG